VALLPDRRAALANLHQLQLHLARLVQLRLAGERQQLQVRQLRLQELHPRELIRERRRDLSQALTLLRALSPQHLLERGFSLVHDERGQLVRSVQGVVRGQQLILQLADGQLSTAISAIHHQSPFP